MAAAKTYCHKCGALMEVAELGGRPRSVCPSCGFVLFRNPVPGVGILVEIDSGIVLIRRGQPPFEGSWALPAGYIEEDEGVEQAALRECREETGLEVELLDLFGVYSFPEGPVQSGIIIFYRARPKGGQLRAGDDACDVALFAPDEIPNDVAFRTHREVLARWLEWQQEEATGPNGLPLTIRNARVSDRERILTLLRLIPANTSMTDAGCEEALLRLREHPGLEVIVAEIEGEVAGFVALSLAVALSGVRILIEDMAVDPRYRRRGIGIALMEAAAQRADERGATHIIFDTSRGDAITQEFYGASGFDIGEIIPLRIR